VTQTPRAVRIPSLLMLSWVIFAYCFIDLSSDLSDYYYNLCMVDFLHIIFWDHIHWYPISPYLSVLRACRYGSFAMLQSPAI